MGTERTKTEKEIDHPLEEIFDIERSTTIVPYTKVKTDLVPHSEYDEKDSELEKQLQELYDLALEAFETQQDEAEVIEPKFKARNAEVAVQYLKTALEAVHEKSQLKQHKDKISTPKDGSGKTVNNNMLITDRNTLLEALADAEKKEKALDGEYEEVDDTQP